uniref:Uncharacterized protein n=1 Tax=Panagrolaimus sp. ES5 TaxID=591445 RepID=A0AC34GT64_9BILA
MSLLTKCDGLNQNSISNYGKAVKIFRNVERNMDFRFIEQSRIEKYTELKDRFYLMAMHHIDFKPIYRNLTRDFGQSNQKVDFQTFYNEIVMAVIFSNYNDSNECWTNVVYVGGENSRVKLQKFLEIVKFGCARAMHLIAVCGNVMYHNNPGSLNAMLNHSDHFAIDISKQITEFINKTVKLAYPEIMKAAIYREVGDNPLEVSALPALSSRIRQALNERDLPEYQYHSFVTTLVEDNVESRYKCKTNHDCFDLSINNVRIFILRYFAQNTVTVDLEENEKFWNQTSKDLNFLFQLADSSYRLDNIAKIFFSPDMLSRWTILVFHVDELQAREGDANKRGGYDSSEYQGAKMEKSMTKYSWNLFWEYNHDYIIYFVY